MDANILEKQWHDIADCMNYSEAAIKLLYFTVSAILILNIKISSETLYSWLYLRLVWHPHIIGGYCVETASVSYR